MNQFAGNDRRLQHAGSLNIEQFFHPLIDFASTPTTKKFDPSEENLSEEELAIYDIITRPSPDANVETNLVKALAKNLLAS